MITRVWHGYTSRENAEAYQRLLEQEILPGIHRISGFEGATLLRRDHAAETEFVTLCRFDSLDAVRSFAGEDYEQCVVPDEARKLLLRFDQRSAHYATVFDTDSESH